MPKFSVPSRKRRPSRIAGLLACAFALFCASPVRAEIELVFGLYTSDKPSTMIRQFRPSLTALEQRLSTMLSEPVIIRTHVAKSYEDGLNDLVAGKVDFARFGPASYVLAKRQEPDLSVLAVESKNGIKIFFGVICVREDSDIRDVSQLKGRSFAFGDENSTIGRYLSQLYLLKHGVAAGDLATYDYLGRHDLVGSAVALGRYDAGALMEKTYKELVKSGMPLRIVARFTNVTKPWIARAGLSERIKTALTRVLLELDDPVALNALSKDGFVEGDDSTYDVIREAMDRNPEFFSQSSAASTD